MRWVLLALAFACTASIASADVCVRRAAAKFGSLPPDPIAFAPKNLASEKQADLVLVGYVRFLGEAAMPRDGWAKGQRYGRYEIQIERALLGEVDESFHTAKGRVTFTAIDTSSQPNWLDWGSLFQPGTPYLVVLLEPDPGQPDRALSLATRSGAGRPGYSIPVPEEGTMVLAIEYCEDHWSFPSVSPMAKALETILDDAGDPEVEATVLQDFLFKHGGFTAETAEKEVQIPIPERGPLIPTRDPAKEF